LKAVLLDDAGDTASANWETRLAKFLCEDVDRGVGIEEAVPNDLADNLVGADRVAFGTRLMAKQTCATLLTKEFEQLKISLFAEAELLGGLGGPDPLALTFDKHGEAEDNEVIRTNSELSGRTDDPMGRHVEMHGIFLREEPTAWEATETG
jgi:hypothetical protein